MQFIKTFFCGMSLLIFSFFAAMIAGPIGFLFVIGLGFLFIVLGNGRKEKELYRKELLWELRKAKKSRKDD